MAATKKQAMAAISKIGATLDPELLATGIYCLSTPIGKVLAYSEMHDYWARRYVRGSVSMATIWGDIKYVAELGLKDCTSQYCVWCPTKKRGN